MGIPSQTRRGCHYEQPGDKFLSEVSQVRSRNVHYLTCMGKF